MINNHQIKIGILGMGYVGLPLAVEFSKHFPVVGFDINNTRISELNMGTDSTKEVSESHLKEQGNLKLTSIFTELEINLLINVVIDLGIVAENKSFCSTDLDPSNIFVISGKNPSSNILSASSKVKIEILFKSNSF